MRMMMCISYMSNYYLCNFLKIINNKKIREKWWTYDDMYILYVKRYTIKIYSILEKWCDT
jgi:hypothetical protein